MTKEGHAVGLLSGDLSIEQRAAIINRFKDAKEKVLITTNVTARGGGLHTCYNAYTLTCLWIILIDEYCVVIWYRFKWDRDLHITIIEKGIICPSSAPFGLCKSCSCKHNSSETHQQNFIKLVFIAYCVEFNIWFHFSPLSYVSLD